MQLTKLPPEAQKSARGEISVLARLQHRNIVRYYDSFDGKSIGLKVNCILYYFFPNAMNFVNQLMKLVTIRK